MVHHKALLALALVVIGLGGRAAAPVIQAAQPSAVAEARNLTAITSTVYLPLIARPAPTIPYVLTKIKLPPGSHPHGIVLDADHQRAFIGNHNGDALSVIDTSALVVGQTIPLAGAHGPNGVAYLAGRDRVYVANRDSDNLSVVDPTAGSWLKNIHVGTQPDGVAVLNDLIYVANFGSNSISVINAQTEVVTNTLTYYSQPALMTKDEARRIVYVSLLGGNYLAALRDGQSIPGLASGVLPYGLDLDTIGGGMYVVNRGAEQRVTVVDAAVNSEADQINIGQEAFVVGVNPHSGHIFVVCGTVVKVYDRRDLALITTIPIGSGAEDGIAVDAERGRVYVTSGDTDEVTVIQDTPAYDIAFLSTRLPEQRLFIMDDTGQHVHTLMAQRPGTWRTTQPTWSPMGTWLAYAYNYMPSGTPNDDQYWGIYLTNHVDADSFWLSRDSAGDNREPAWSPDGSQLVWRCGDNLCVRDVDGQHLHTLSITGTGVSCYNPLWAPDGQWIAAECGTQVYIIPASGGTAMNVSQNTNGTIDSYPSWSPDSSRIAFDTDRHYFISGTQRIDNYEIYVADIQTLQLTRLTSNTLEDRAPIWSPDGEWLAYAAGTPLYLPGGQITGYDHELTLMKPDGSQQHQVTTGLYMAGLYSWSPDSRRIVLQSRTDAAAEIYVVDVSSGAVTRLTNNSFADTSPVWRPDTWR